MGACIGLTGIAGFLLPIFYVSVLTLDPVASLALAFSAFVVSGILGWPAYRASGDLPLRECGWLALGSLVGAVAGVFVGLALPAQVLTVILYIVVLVSGTTVLVRMRPKKSIKLKDDAQTGERSVAVYVAVGVVTAVICAASGAGGPVLVVPILMLLGFSPRSAVGMSLLDSVAIGIPSAIGYFVGGSIDANVWSLLLPALIGHGIGTIAGSMNAHRINATVLKVIVAVGSIGVALYKLAGMLLG